MPARYEPGYQNDVYVLCDICGFKNRLSKTKKMWDGLRACNPECYNSEKDPDTLPTPKYPNEGRSIGTGTEPTDVYIDPTAQPDPDSL